MRYVRSVGSYARDKIPLAMDSGDIVALYTHGKTFVRSYIIMSRRRSKLRWSSVTRVRGRYNTVFESYTIPVFVFCSYAIRVGKLTGIPKPTVFRR